MDGLEDVRGQRWLLLWSGCTAEVLYQHFLIAVGWRIPPAVLPRRACLKLCYSCRCKCLLLQMRTWICGQGPWAIATMARQLMLAWFASDGACLL